MARSVRLPWKYLFMELPDTFDSAFARMHNRVNFSTTLTGVPVISDTASKV
jgi:hypothetical protein